jgi:hypothetical protein
MVYFDKDKRETLEKQYVLDDKSLFTAIQSNSKKNPLKVLGV